jgi:hypothetical protein
MANLFFTGFEGIANGQTARRGSSSNAPIVTGRFGNGVACDSSSFVSPLWTGVSEVIAGIAHKPAAGNNTILEFREGATVHVYVRVDVANLRYQVYHGGGTLLQSSANSSLTVGSWSYVELRSVIHDTTGVVELRVNGVSVGVVTGLDTRNGATGVVDRVALTGAVGSAVTDDFYVNDTTGSAPHNTFYGDIRVDRVDTAADSSVQFTPSASTNESCIDDGNAPDDDTTYNASSTAGHKDMFTVSGYTAPSGTILGVAVRTVVRKTDAGARTFNNVVDSGGTVVESTPVSLSTSYIEHTQSLYTDPDTGVAWANAAAINALLIGYEIDT